MHSWQTNADGSVTCEHGTVKPPRACAVCAASALPDEPEAAPGQYEAMTNDANAAGMVDRLGAEAIMWARSEALMALDAEAGRDAAELADEIVEAKRNGDLRTVQGLRMIRTAVLGLRIRAVAEAGKYVRAASEMILWRERKADNERADRLYADRQRKVGRQREVH